MKQIPSNPYYQYINATPPEMISARTFELCKQASVTKECVTGISGCILAWKSHHEPMLVVRAMTDAYIQRSSSPQTKLAIVYIFNDIVQRDPTTFADIGYRFLFQVIAPIVSTLPPDIHKAHSRTLEILKERQIYTKEEIGALRKAFGLNRMQQRQLLVTSCNRNEDAKSKDALFDVCQPAIKGKIDASIKATKAICQDPHTANAAMAWAKSLLTAAGLSIASGRENFEPLDPESRKALAAAISRALNFIGLEMELIQYLILDWSIAVEENKSRLLFLTDALGKDLDFSSTAIIETNASSSGMMTAASTSGEPVAEAGY